MVEKLVLSVRVPKALLEKIDSEAIATEENRAAIVTRHLMAAYGLGGGDESLTPTALEKLTGQIEALTARIEALEQNQGKGQAIATEPAKNDDVSEISPSRMPSIERKEPVTMNHPKAIQGADNGAEKRRLLGNADFIAAAAKKGIEVTRNHATNWKRAGKFSSKPEGILAAQYFGVIQGKGFYRLQGDRHG
jgi:hypothetical protein